MGIGEPPQVELDRGNTKSPSHKSADLQFARFLEAAERLGSSLDRNFDDLFVSIVLAPACLAAERPGGMSISSRGSSQSAAEIEPAIKKEEILVTEVTTSITRRRSGRDDFSGATFSRSNDGLALQHFERGTTRKTVKQGFGNISEARRDLGKSGDASRHASGVPRGLERDAEHAGEQSPA